MALRVPVLLDSGIQGMALRDSGRACVIKDLGRICC